MDRALRSRILEAHLTSQFQRGYNICLWRGPDEAVAKSLVEEGILEKDGPRYSLSTKIRVMLSESSIAHGFAYLMGTQEGWVLATPCDQTIAYIMEDGSTTLLPSEAKVFASEAEAESARDEDFLVAVTHVPNVAHFRMGEPAWMDRPASMVSLFALARTIMDLLGNENLRTEKFEVRSEAYLLQCAAEVFLKALGHKDKDGAWVFGKSPGPTAGEVS